MRKVPKQFATAVATLPGKEIFSNNVTVSATAATFTSGNFGIGVSNSSGTPRLSVIADGWSKFRVKSCVIRYKPICPTSTTGRFVMTAGYDILDTAPTSFAGTAGGIQTVSGPLYKEMSMSVDCSHLSKPWYIAQPGNAGTELNTPIVIYYGTDQGTSAITCGYLSIEYVVTLADPISLSINT